MKSPDSFQEIRQKIHLYFDNALSTEDQDNLLQQVDDDPRCQKMFHKEKNFREFLKTSVKRSSVSPDLIQSIRDRIKVV